MQECIVFMKLPVQPERRHNSCAMRLGSGVARLADRSAMATLSRPAGCKAAQRHKTAQVFAAVYAVCAGVPPVPPFFSMLSGGPTTNASKMTDKAMPVAGCRTRSAAGVPCAQVLHTVWKPLHRYNPLQFRSINTRVVTGSGCSLMSLTLRIFQPGVIEKCP